MIFTLILLMIVAVYLAPVAHGYWLIGSTLVWLPVTAEAICIVAAIVVLLALHKQGENREAQDREVQ